MEPVRYCDLCDERYGPSPDGQWGYRCRRCKRTFGPCCQIETDVCAECAVVLFPGRVPTEPCGVCDGTGTIQCRPGYMGSSTGAIPCNWCDATGRRPNRQPAAWKRPRRIFVNSMSDLFHSNVPDEFIHRVFDVMEMQPR